jgi:hypothetical protein
MNHRSSVDLGRSFRPFSSEQETELRHPLLLPVRVLRGAGPQRPYPASLAIPSKRHDKRQGHFLTQPEIEAILAAPDCMIWLGRRDHTLLLLTALKEPVRRKRRSAPTLPHAS